VVNDNDNIDYSAWDPKTLSALINAYRVEVDQLREDLKLALAEVRRLYVEADRDKRYPSDESNA
jgi:hypothetical protein